MRFLILGDLHGQMPKFHYKDFDAIIAPGDFCSDAHRPFMFQALRHNLANPGQEVAWFQLIGKKKAKKLIDTSVRDGRKVLEKLNAVGVPVYIVPGNNDWTAAKSSWSYEGKDHFRKLTKGLKNIVNVYHRKIDIGEYIIVGDGITSGPECPQGDVRRYTKKELHKKRQALEKKKKILRKLITNKPLIFISHNVPYNTKIDLIVNKHSPLNGHHMGSVLVRDIIKEKKPVVCIGGHMHEHFKAIKIGKTTCINAGYGSGCNILMMLDGKVSLKFHGKAQKY